MPREQPQIDEDRAEIEKWPYNKMYGFYSSSFFSFWKCWNHIFGFHLFDLFQLTLCSNSNFLG